MPASFSCSAMAVMMAAAPPPTLPHAPLEAATMAAAPWWCSGPTAVSVSACPRRVSTPSNIEFAGADLRTLLATEDESNAVYRIEVDVPGLKLF